MDRGQDVAVAAGVERIPDGDNDVARTVTVQIDFVQCYLDIQVRLAILYRECKPMHAIACQYFLNSGWSS
jgi:hypothetical protein